MKPTLVLSGGGPRNVYLAGFVFGLLRQGIGASFFQEIFGTSGGGCVGAYYAGEQELEGRRIFVDRLPNKFIKWPCRTDMPYLEHVLRKLEALNVKALAACPTKVYMSLTDVNTQQPEAICLNDAPDPVAVMLAGVSWTKARPLNGSLYADGGFTAQVPLEFADQKGAKKIWVLSVRPPGHQLSPALYKAASLLLVHRPKIRRLVANMAKTHNRNFRDIDHRTDILVIRPGSELPIDPRGTSSESIDAAYELGLQTAYKFVVDHEKEL